MFNSEKPSKKSPWEDDTESKKPENYINTNFDSVFLKNKFNNHLKNYNSNGFFSKKIFFILIFVVITLWLSSGFYVVDEGEQALVIRFGKYQRTASTGLNYRLPEPFENVIIERVDTLRKEEIGFRTTKNSANSNDNNISMSQESLMLTGDENIVDINFIVQWKIDNLKEYIFNIMNSRETVRSVAESAMREVISNTSIDKAITDGRSLVENEAKTILQRILNDYKSGVEITTLKLLRADPPAEVIDAFRDKQTAKTDKEREINRADAFSNEVLPKARGESAKIILESEAYKIETVEQAKGDVARFDLVYNQYKAAKDITKKRLYLEAMESILQGMDKIILDSKNGASLVPYYNINQQDKVK